MKSFDLIEIGEEAEIVHQISEKDVEAFASLTGDYNPLHMDDAFAATTPFKKRVVHGMLSASFISTIIGMKIPGTGALWFSQNLKFLLPVRIGETIVVKAKVKSKSEALQIITITTDIWNSQDKKVVEGEARVKLVDSTEKTTTAGKITNNSYIAQTETARQVAQTGGNKTVIITGASGGIGSAIALKLAQNGYNLVLNYRSNAKGAQELVESIKSSGGNAIAVQSDITSEEDCKALVELARSTYGNLYGLIHNASATPNASEFLKSQWNETEAHVNTQVKAMFHLCQEMIPELLTNGIGSIVAISSIYADNKPPAQLAGYSLAKAALNSLARSLAVEFGLKNIRTNIIAPGMTETPMIADIPDKTKMLNKVQNPMRRLAHPEDIANVAEFLLGTQSAYINGETIRVTGGSTMI